MLLATAFLCALLGARDLSIPASTFACSCMPLQPIAEYAKEPGNMVLSGTIGPVANQEAPFLVDRLYKGSLSNPLLRIQGGDGAMCGVTLVEGTRVLTVANVEGGVVFPSICAPFGDLSTAEGQRLEKEAQETFGNLVPVPGTAPPTDPPAGVTEPVLDSAQIGLVVLAGVLAVVVAMFGVVAIVARNRRGAS